MTWNGFNDLSQVNHPENKEVVNHLSVVFVSGCRLERCEAVKMRDTIDYFFSSRLLACLLSVGQTVLKINLFAYSLLFARLRCLSLFSTVKETPNLHVGCAILLLSLTKDTGWSCGLGELPQNTPASSRWSQLWTNHPLCLQSVSELSLPVQATLSSQMGPVPTKSGSRLVKTSPNDTAVQA